jgi:hypothetical protein
LLRRFRLRSLSYGGQVAPRNDVKTHVRIPAARCARVLQEPSAPEGVGTPDIALKGLIAGSSLMFGAFIAKRFVLRLEPEVFRLVMDGIMLAAGLSMLWNAAQST